MLGPKREGITGISRQLYSHKFNNFPPHVISDQINVDDIFRLRFIVCGDGILI
jgi:hypothetical protein